MVSFENIDYNINLFVNILAFVFSVFIIYIFHPFIPSFFPTIDHIKYSYFSCSNETFNLVIIQYRRKAEFSYYFDANLIHLLNYNLDSFNMIKMLQSMVFLRKCCCGISLKKGSLIICYIVLVSARYRKIILSQKFSY